MYTKNLFLSDTILHTYYIRKRERLKFHAQAHVRSLRVVRIERGPINQPDVRTDLEYICGTGLYISPIWLPASIFLAANVPMSLAALTCCDRMAVAIKSPSPLPMRGTGAQATSPAANTSPEG